MTYKTKVARLKKVLFRLTWLTMSTRKRYLYLWGRGGSLHHQTDN
jgi:hypothetical protein